MKIATIVGSASHVKYTARVFGRYESETPPAPSDYSFGSFVSIEADGRRRGVAVVADSAVVNPAYAEFGPRLSDANQLREFSPDVLDERGTEISLVAVGTLETGGTAEQGIPPLAFQAGAGVRKLEIEEIASFHLLESGLKLAYFGVLIEHCGALGTSLVERIAANLAESLDLEEDEVARLDVLRRSVRWQRTVGKSNL